VNRWDRRLLVAAALIASLAAGVFVADATGHPSDRGQHRAPTHQPSPIPATPMHRRLARWA